MGGSARPPHPPAPLTKDAHNGWWGAPLAPHTPPRSTPTYTNAGGLAAPQTPRAQHQGWLLGDSPPPRPPALNTKNGCWGARRPPDPPRSTPRMAAGGLAAPHTPRTHHQGWLLGGSPPPTPPALTQNTSKTSILMIFMHFGTQRTFSKKNENFRNFPKKSGLSVDQNFHWFCIFRH